MKEYYQAVSDFHKKHEMKGTNNEDMTFRLNLMIEELGELAQAVTKNKELDQVVEENIDLLYLVIGNFISLGLTPEQVDEAFRKKHNKNMTHEKRITGKGKFRVSEFRNMQ